jgi:hypothetical protein
VSNVEVSPAFRQIIQSTVLFTDKNSQDRVKVLLKSD